MFTTLNAFKFCHETICFRMIFRLKKMWCDLKNKFKVHTLFTLYRQKYLKL